MIAPVLTEEVSRSFELSTGAMMAVAIAAITVLLILIIKFKLHAFFALIIVSLATALGAGIQVNEVVDVVIEGFGDTVADVALLVGFGAVLGRLVEVSGGAQVLADKMLDLFGERRAPFALGVASMLYAFPIFLDAGFIVMLPIIYTVARRLKGGFMIYVLPAIGAFQMMHALTPPHPGPTAAATVMGADVGLVLLVALAVGVPTWYLCGYRLGLLLAKQYPNMPVPSLLGEPDIRDERERPTLGTVMLCLLFPLALIFLNTAFDTLEQAGSISTDHPGYVLGQLIGPTPVALLLAALLAMYLLYLKPRRGTRGMGDALTDLVDHALAPVCAIILITGAGGAFGRVLTETGIGGEIAGRLEAMGLPIILVGFLMAVVIRIAQGSATVAATVAAGIMASSVDELNLGGVPLAALVVAIVAGAITFSHVNDSGFWLVGRFCGFDTVTTFRTWSVLGTAIGFMAFLLAWGLYAVAI